MYVGGGNLPDVQARVWVAQHCITASVEISGRTCYMLCDIKSITANALYTLGYVVAILPF